MKKKRKPAAPRARRRTGRVAASPRGGLDGAPLGTPVMVAAPRIEPMLTPIQLAHRLQCSTKTVRRMVHGRKIPFVRVGPHGLLRFRLHQVENHLAVEVPAVAPIAPSPPKPSKPDGGSSAPSS